MALNRERILEYLGPDWDRVSFLMRSAVKSDIGLLSSTNEAVLNHPGKLLRPTLALLVARACGQSNDNSCKVAASTELLHNATLIHDDVADCSSERRGKPSVNNALGPGHAVLVGDFWLAKTMEMMMDIGGLKDRVASFFSKTLVDLAEGEMLQLEKASEADTTEDDYFRIIYCKTASLFEAACASAALSVGAPEEYVAAVRTYAKAAGLAFQIRDDIFDYEEDAEIGKPVGIDLLEKKITLPLLCALKGSLREKEIRALVRDIDKCPVNCQKVREFVKEHHGSELALARLESFVGTAIGALDALPESEAKEHLKSLARYIAERKA